jgi:transmembrane sensor
MEPRSTPPDTPISADLLDRFLARECTPDERARVEQWRDARPENAELLRALGAAASAPTPNWDVATAWERVASRMSIQASADIDRLDAASVVETPREEEAARQAPREPARVREGATRPTGLPTPPALSRHPGLTRRPVANPRLVRWAAVVMIALGGAAVWRVAARDGTSAPEGSTAVVAYAAPVGETVAVRLPDDSEVTLAPASRIELSPDFAETRDVRLSGEAFFRVTHDPSHPFRVLSGGNAARVLGTEFDVRTGRGSEALVVALVSGLLGVGPASAEPATVLEPGQMATLDEAGAARVGPADLERILAWRSGRIELNQMTLADALTELERWYDVDLRVEDAALGAKRLSASFAGEPIEQVLETLTFALGARWERAGSVYRVVPATAPR